jgi:nucleoside-diphosphate-sugar epimerase
MKVLLTGTTGFVGSYVLRRFLADSEAQVAVLLRRTSDTWRIADVLERAAVVRADLADEEALRAAVAEAHPHLVVHMAWRGVGSRFRNDAMQVANIAETCRLLRLAHEAGAAAFVSVGSQAEYGPCRGAVGEEAPARPTTLYGIAKLSACLLAGRLCEEYGMRFAWLRLFSSYGPKDSGEWLIPYVIRSLLRGERPALTEGEQVWDYLYVEDAAEAIYRVAASPQASGVFNLGSGSTQTIRSVVEGIRDRIDESLALGFGEKPYRPDQVMHLEADVRRLKEATGWTPRVSLDEGLDRTVAWYRSAGVPAGKGGAA